MTIPGLYRTIRRTATTINASLRIVATSFAVTAASLLILTFSSESASAQTAPSLTPTAPVIPRTASTEKAIAAATAFMTAVITDSNADNLIKLCSLPFCHDDSIILTTTTELRHALTEFITAAARERTRSHPRVDSAFVLDIRKEALFGMVPINIYFTVVHLKFSVGGKEATKILILAIQLTDDARVVGIED
jgi:hypothetical protein